MVLGSDDLTQAAMKNGGDVETEQLLSEIELLTSRALQETNQWRATADVATVEVRGSESNNCNRAENNNTWAIDIVGNADGGVK